MSLFLYWAHLLTSTPFLFKWWL